MRIVVLSDSSVPNGGLTQLAVRGALLMAARGHEVLYFAGDSGPAPELFAQAGIRLIALGDQGLIDLPAADAMRQGLHNARAARALSQMIDLTDTPETVYHLHGWSTILSPSVMAALGPVAPRTVIHAHDHFLTCPNGIYFSFPANDACTRKPLGAACLATQCDKRSGSHKAWRVLRQMRVRKQLMRSDWGAVALIHPSMAETFARAGLGHLPLQVLRNPGAPWSLSRIPAEANARVLYVGRLIPGKGARTLCEAARRAGLPLDLVGDGTLRAELAAEFPEATFHGWRDADGIASVARGARVLVMPSEYPEPFGLVAAEASLSGLPIVVGDSSALADDVQQGRLGWQFPAGHVQALADILAQVDRCPAHEIAAISQRGVSGGGSLAPENAEWADRLEALYARLLQPAGSRLAAQ